ncbi:hypothetical protein V2611_08395 [Tenacibaculum maritimum]|uniref:hypothetical protein n=1 Tax=Tenacibaculum maritimum TaxID=107401 RepID=UPI00387755FE
MTTNGIINLNEGRPFFQGAGLAALTGAIGGAFAFGIGEAVSGLKGFLKVAVQTLAHGHLGGVMSVAMGGDYFSGFAAGAVGSAIGHYTKLGLEKAGANNFWKASGIITAGSLSGGVGSFVSGGKFWDGFRNGAISSSLNHVAHMIQESAKSKKIVKNAKKQDKSKKWSYEAERDNFKSKTNKCNKFVYDILTESGASPGLPNGNPIKKFFGYGSPPTASQWADPNYDIPGWDVVSSPKAGDVVAVSANFSDATDHVGIMISETQSIGASHHTVRITNFGTTSYDLSVYPGNNGYIYRRYVGN